MLNGNVTCFGDCIGDDAQRVADDLLGSAITLRQVVLRDGYINPRADLGRGQNMDNGQGTPRSAASRAAQSVATCDASDPSAPTTIPWMLASEGPDVEVISLSFGPPTTGSNWTHQTLSARADRRLGALVITHTAKRARLQPHRSRTRLSQRRMARILGDLHGAQYASASIQRQRNQVCGDRRARCQLLINVGDDSLDLITRTGGESGAECRHHTLQFIVHHRSHRGGHAKSLSSRRTRRLRTKGPNSTARVPGCPAVESE